MPLASNGFAPDGSQQSSLEDLGQAGRQGRPGGKARRQGRGSNPRSGSKDRPAANVTLKQVAAQLAEAHSMPKNQAEALASSLVGVLVKHLKAGDRLRIGGLGILEVKNRPARTGRNPATGAPIQIAASKKIAFRPAKELKEAI